MNDILWKLPVEEFQFHHKVQLCIHSCHSLQILPHRQWRRYHFEDHQHWSLRENQVFDRHKHHHVIDVDNPFLTRRSLLDINGYSQVFTSRNPPDRICNFNVCFFSNSVSFALFIFWKIDTNVSRSSHLKIEWQLSMFKIDYLHIKSKWNDNFFLRWWHFHSTMTIQLLRDVNHLKISIQRLNRPIKRTYMQLDTVDEYHSFRFLSSSMY